MQKRLQNDEGERFVGWETRRVFQDAVLEEKAGRGFAS
jgi:hypothetical protein